MRSCLVFHWNTNVTQVYPKFTQINCRVSLGLDDMEGDLSPPYGGGDKAVIGGTDGEGHILYGGTHTSNSF